RGLAEQGRLQGAEIFGQAVELLRWVLEQQVKNRAALKFVLVARVADEKITAFLDAAASVAGERVLQLDRLAAQAVTALEISVARRQIVEREFPEILARQQFRRLKSAGEQVHFEPNAARVRPWHVERPSEAAH